MLAASLLTSVPACPMAIPISADLRATASLTPSPVIDTMAPALCKACGGEERRDSEARRSPVGNHRMGTEQNCGAVLSADCLLITSIMLLSSLKWPRRGVQQKQQYCYIVVSSPSALALVFWSSSWSWSCPGRPGHWQNSWGPPPALFLQGLWWIWEAFSTFMIFSLCFGLVLKKMEIWKTKTHDGMRWMLVEMEQSLDAVFKTITFLTVEESSDSATWSSSSPDMAFSFPLQRPIFCPAKKSPEWRPVHQLWKKATISWLEEQQQQFKSWWRQSAWQCGNNTVLMAGAGTTSSPLLSAACTVCF